MEKKTSIGLKRRAEEHSSGSTAITKRTRKSSALASNDETTLVQGRILLLEKEIFESKKNYNNITKLVHLAKGENNENDATPVVAAAALARVFIRLLAGGTLRPRKDLPEKKLVVIHWLRERLCETKDMLLDMLLWGGEGSVTALTFAVRVLKAEGEFLVNKDKDDYSFPRAFLRQIVARVLRGSEERLRVAFVKDFANKHTDVQYYALQSVKDILSEPNSSNAASFDSALSVLSSTVAPPANPPFDSQCLLTPPTKKSHPLLSSTQHRKALQDAWLALLALGITMAQRKVILRILVPTIAPAFSRPELLADFLTDSYDSGGATSLLALSGVYHLMRERNLDYPSFYPKLYSLLDRDLLHSKHRSRFFRLLDEFLASTHLPAVLVASFIKRLARLSLNAPPAAVVFVVPWMYNLFRRHPLCTFMMHRELRGEHERERAEREGWGDTFDENEPDPMLTGAIESSIWEVVQLQSHWHPNVATVAKIVSEQFTKASYNMEDFLDHSYMSLLEAEMAKQIRKPPVVEFQIPKKIFLPHHEGSSEGVLLAKLWDCR